MTDFYHILKTLDRIQNEDLDPQQKSVKQLPALFRPRNTSPQLSGPYPGRNATQGYLVGENEQGKRNPERSIEVSPAHPLYNHVQAAIINHIARGFVRGAPRVASGLASQQFLINHELVIAAAKQVADRVYEKNPDLHEIDYRNLDPWVAEVEKILAANPKVAEVEKKLAAAANLKSKKNPPKAVGVNEQGKWNPERSPDDNAVLKAIMRRIERDHSSLLDTYGPKLVLDVAKEVADFVGDVEEIGSSDVSIWVNDVESTLKRFAANPNYGRESSSTLGENRATEDVVSSVKKKLGDYLADLSKEIKHDSGLKDKGSKNTKNMPAVKTMTTDDGKEIKIHGNEDDGFRITIKNKPHSAHFESLDHAVMACEMYMNRRRQRRNTMLNQDYLEEQK